jgi:hypothetical protein
LRSADGGAVSPAVDVVVGADGGAISPAVDVVVGADGGALSPTFDIAAALSIGEGVLAGVPALDGAAVSGPFGTSIVGD